MIPLSSMPTQQVLYFPVFVNSLYYVKVNKSICDKWFVLYYVLAPTTPPNITSVSRAVGDGRTIDVAFTVSV